MKIDIDKGKKHVKKTVMIYLVAMLHSDIKSSPPEKVICVLYLICFSLVLWRIFCRRFHHHYHHYHVVLPARISLTLSRHFSLASIAPGRYSRLHPVSAQCYCI